MASRGSNKHRSQQHEEYIASLYGGTVSPSSGAGPTDRGDVRVESAQELIECKTTGGPEKPARSTMVKQMEKIADEAWTEMKEPLLALRFFMPDSPLADSKGFVDLIVRTTKDDAHRSSLLAQLSAGPFEDCPENGVRYRLWPSS